ncbi:MAG TPA: FAD:protein FMN transferase [Acidimicrobiia bacterium]|nr:FAD:protein FMN transferase [Acidimicrobiia bacterium]
MHTLTFPALGTTAAMLVEVDAELGRARSLLDAEINRIDRACSRFRDDSEMALVNAGASSWVTVSPLFAEALDVALRAARLTDGLVDPTVGRAMRILGYDRDFERVDREGPPLRVSVRRVAGWQTIEFDRRRPAVRIPRGVELDFGATAKALCADRAARAIGRATGSGVLIGLGGDVAVGGPVPAEGWTVLIADHHGASPEAVDERIVIRSGGVATSGTTARRWTRGECVLHHVLDPATGLPAKEHWRTVSVSAASCVDANIASTAALVMGARAPGWLESLHLPARLVASDGQVVHVGGWPEPAGRAAC